jgi:hypothetical protein
MKSIIITKWIEPYKLLETIKSEYEFKDFTFDGITKPIEKKKFFKELEAGKNSVGLYMKNVNKYYLFNKDESFALWDNLVEIFSFTNGDFEVSQDTTNKPFDMVDLGKAEASLIFND